MQIFVINLDEKIGRWQRMAGLLAGLPFQRIAAVDGKTIEGPERNQRHPRVLSRYHQACTLSHRLAYQAFLTSADRYCCILEDDVFISPDFPKFIHDDSWIPKGCDLVKIETTRQATRFVGQKLTCLRRHAVRLYSLHLGAAGYIVSRRGAEILLEMTANPDRAVDRILFGWRGRRRLKPIYQLIPALCIQGNHRDDGASFPDMESSIQRHVKPETPRPVPRRIQIKTDPGPQTLSAKVQRELIRPFQQLLATKKAVGRRLAGLERMSVPFA